MERVPVWNRKLSRQFAGNVAPLRKNLDKYLQKYPECEVYDGQEADESGSEQSDDSDDDEASSSDDMEEDESDEEHARRRNDSRFVGVVLAHDALQDWHCDDVATAEPIFKVIIHVVGGAARRESFSSTCGHRNLFRIICLRKIFLRNS